MFEKPAKRDIDAALSLLMHEARGDRATLIDGVLHRFEPGS